MGQDYVALIRRWSQTADTGGHCMRVVVENRFHCSTFIPMYCTVYIKPIVKGIYIL